MTASQVVQAARITAIWPALGGGEIRHGRGQAFWRQGDGWSISLDDSKNTWYDFTEGVGGGLLDLIQKILGGTRVDALMWLADVSGASIDENTPAIRKDFADHARIAADAAYFADAAIVMAEEALEVLPDNDSGRAEWTRLIGALRGGPEAEYREWWRNGNAEMAVALVHVGRERSRRLQQMLAGYLVTEGIDIA